MIFRRIGRAFRRVVNFGKDLFKTVTKPLSSILKNPLAALSKILGKLPLPDVVTGFIDKFMNGPLGGLLTLLPGPIGGIAALLQKASTVGDVFNIVRDVAGSDGFQNAPPAGRNNVFELAASQHARISFPQIFS